MLYKLRKEELVPVTLILEKLSPYYTDNEVFKITINNTSKFIHVPFAEAKLFKDNLNSLEVTALMYQEATSIDKEYYHITIKNPANDAVYQFEEYKKNISKHNLEQSETTVTQNTNIHSLSLDDIKICRHCGKLNYQNALSCKECDIDFKDQVYDSEYTFANTYVKHQVNSEFFVAYTPAIDKEDFGISLGLKNLVGKVGVYFTTIGSISLNTPDSISFQPDPTINTMPEVFGKQDQSYISFGLNYQLNPDFNFYLGYVNCSIETTALDISSATQDDLNYQFKTLESDKGGFDFGIHYRLHQLKHWSANVVLGYNTAASTVIFGAGFGIDYLSLFKR